MPLGAKVFFSAPCISARAVFFALFVFCTIPPGANARPCRIRPTNYKGWNAQEIRNEWVTLTIVPKLGGRLMQVSFGPHEYLFVNKHYEGQYLPPLGPNDAAKWYNYGGDKIWPLPEGHQDEQHWPGPLADALDDGDYAFSIVSQGSVCKVRLDGPADPRTGLQYSREIGLPADSPKISFHAIIKNASEHAIRWSVQSVTQYNTADPAGRNPSDEIWAFTPANEHSSYSGGYFVEFGKGPPPALNIKNGLVALNYRFFQNELWLDTQGGWVAVADAVTQYAMVERFQVRIDKEYPGQATLIFYTTGDGRGDDPLYYMEAEVNSPMVSLQPGETYAMDTEWYPTRAGSDVLGVTDAGVIEEHLRISRPAASQKLTGKFGVFFDGKLLARFLDQEGKTITEKSLKRVRSLKPLNLAENMRLPRKVSRVVLEIVTSKTQERYRLDELSLAPGETND